LHRLTCRQKTNVEEIIRASNQTTANNRTTKTASKYGLETAKSRNIEARTQQKKESKKEYWRQDDKLLLQHKKQITKEILENKKALEKKLKESNKKTIANIGVLGHGSRNNGLMKFNGKSISKSKEIYQRCDKTKKNMSFIKMSSDAKK